MIWTILVWMKDAVLCLLICSTLANIKKKKQHALVSVGLILLLFLLGLD